MRKGVCKSNDKLFKPTWKRNRRAKQAMETLRSFKSKVEKAGEKGYLQINKATKIDITGKTAAEVAKVKKLYDKLLNNTKI